MTGNFTLPCLINCVCFIEMFYTIRLNTRVKESTLTDTIWHIAVAWKVSVFEVILVRIFPHSDWVTPNRDTFYAAGKKCVKHVNFVNFVIMYEYANSVNFEKAKIN